MSRLTRLEGLNENIFAIQQYRNLNAADNCETVKKLQKVLAIALEEELNEKQRSILIKYYYDGQTMQEIADVYGINRATVSRYISRSIKKLKHVLKYTLPLFIFVILTCI